MEYKKTRIAPTPSGYLHLGNVLSFLITATLARRHGARLLLRIDDLDAARLRKEFVQDIFSTLEFIGIPWDEGPRNYQDYTESFNQSLRFGEYSAALDQLKNSGDLFACTCSRKTINNTDPAGSYPGVCKNKGLSFDRKDVNWRIHTFDHEIEIKDVNGAVRKMSLPPSLKDFVVRKKDGLPAYQLATVINDLLDEVDLIVRGADMWASDVAQMYLLEKLKGTAHPPKYFHHHPLMLDSANKKMSKSANSTSIQYLRTKGVTKNEVFKRIGEFLNINQPIVDFQSFQQAYCLQFPNN